MAGGRPITDRTGHVYGRLTVLGRDPNYDGGPTRWMCRCECGEVVLARGSALNSGDRRSCGCLVKDTRVSPILDRVGVRYGMLTAVERTDRRGGGGDLVWRCSCDCGGEIEVRGSALTSGNTRSCGCLHALVSSENAKHGLWATPEYVAWQNMIRRCTDPKNPRYSDYGGRGIKVCQDWLDSVEAFVADVGMRPPEPPGMSLDRVDVNGNYEKSNVKWSTRSEQQKNKRPYVRATKADIVARESRIAELEAEVARLKGDGDNP